MAILASPELTPTAPARGLVGLSDGELVAAVRHGDDRAFEQLYARYHRRIAAYVYGMVDDHGRAEDIAQEVFMSALRRMRETERPIAFKAWLYEIAKNACIDQFRRSRRSEEVSYDAEEGLGAADYGRLVTTSPAPDVAVEQKVAIENLQGAFGGLSQQHHEILVLRELEGLSYTEIGERLGMSRPAVESTLFRARRRLGQEYEELVSGERCQRVQGIIVAAGAAQGRAGVGSRDQRRLAAHLSHCQPCRRHAVVAGLDTATVTKRRGARAKIAAWLPMPAFLRRRWFPDDAAPVGNAHVGSLAQLSAQVGTVVDPAVASWAKAAAAAATLAVAGVTGGAAIDDESRSDSGARPAGAPVPAATIARASRKAAPAAKPTSAATAAGGRVVAARPAAPSSPSVRPAATGGAPGPSAKAGAPATASAAPPAAGVPALPSSSAAQPVLGSFDPDNAATGSGRPRPNAGIPAVDTAAAAVGDAVDQTTGKGQLGADGAAAVTQDAVDAITATLGP